MNEPTTASNNNGAGHASGNGIDIDAEIAAMEERLRKLKRLHRLKDRVEFMESIAAAMDEALVKILELTCEEFKVSETEVFGRSREEQFTWPRHVTVWLLRCCSAASLSSMGQMMGGRDHGTMIHSIHAVKNRMETEPRFAALVRKLEQKTRACLSNLPQAGKMPAPHYRHD